MYPLPSPSLPLKGPLARFLPPPRVTEALCTTSGTVGSLKGGFLIVLGVFVMYDPWNGAPVGFEQLLYDPEALWRGKPHFLDLLGALLPFLLTFKGFDVTLPITTHETGPLLILSSFSSWNRGTWRQKGAILWGELISGLFRSLGATLGYFRRRT